MVFRRGATRRRVAGSGTWAVTGPDPAHRWPTHPEAAETDQTASRRELPPHPWSVRAGVVIRSALAHLDTSRIFAPVPCRRGEDTIPGADRAHPPNGLSGCQAPRGMPRSGRRRPERHAPGSHRCQAVSGTGLADRRGAVTDRSLTAAPPVKRDDRGPCAGSRVGASGGRVQRSFRSRLVGRLTIGSSRKDAPMSKPAVARAAARIPQRSVRGRPPVVPAGTHLPAAVCRPAGS